MAQLLQNSTIGGKQIASEEFVSNKVKTDVPVDAKFTDTTYYEITEAEINTGTASTLRTITARRVTFILSKVSTLISNAISALTKNDVGLGNVDNTSDVNKPVSTAQQTALNAKLDKSSVKQVLGTSTTDVMSQKAVTQLLGDYIQSDLSVKHIIALTQGEYDAIPEKDAQTLYFIKQV